MILVNAVSLKLGNQGTLSIKANYLALPPLVVAYAVAGDMDIDLTADPLGQDSAGQPILLRQELAEPVDSRGGQVQGHLALS